MVRATARRLRDLRRRTADRRFGIHLLGSAAVAAVAAVPFGLLLVLVEGQWQPLRRLDAGAARRLHETALDHPAWTDTLRFLSDRVWDPFTLRTAVALLTGWLLYRRAWRLAAWSAVTATAGGFIGLLVKTVVERARPALEDPVAHAPGFSFPSGHAMTATTSFAILLLVLLPMVPRPLRALCWCAAVGSVLGVGFTRVALGVHWFSDVVGGWLLGLAVVALTTWAFEAWRTDTGRGHAGLSEGLEPELTDARPEPGPSARRHGDGSGRG
ncbi:MULTISPECIES: phosphatase PAP2 family protein [unclassified Streptomyces]|uniref:phosphatase PAP2 family protein n=1 Tax=unclassified Streptomyces TaxID=2593676 RepID=UPI00190A7DCE|nr:MULTISPECIES: phosphatase PAP2 family protein [unclassified Streptomyces]MBK3563253.1 phosphatase PAP2 family protein [Streptomyces sp. MBT62]MBK6012218.1 phosphatase PAP2 family protein [Streptomyces sp. MBT53]